MSETGLGIVLVLAGYLCGSIPFGFVLAKLLLGVDVRTVGSGNIGGTNVARVGGKKLGIAVVVLDAVKAIVPILLARAVLGGPFAGVDGGYPRDVEIWVVAVAIAALLGHVFPVWLRFRGGKGVATAFGIFLVLAPVAALAGIVAYAVAYAATRISSVGSLAGTAVTAAATFMLNGPRRPVSWAGLVLALLIVLRHRDNIRRLLSGEEKRKMRV